MDTLCIVLTLWRGVHWWLVAFTPKGPIVQIFHVSISTVKLPIIWDTKTVLWSHCNAVKVFKILALLHEAPRITALWLIKYTVHPDGNRQKGNKKHLIISWYLHVRNGVAVVAYSRLASRSQAKFHIKKLSPLVGPCAAAPAQSTTSAHRSLDFRRVTSSQRGRWVGSWPLLLRSVHEDTS